MSKHAWLDQVVISDDLAVESKAAAIELFRYILEDGSIAPCPVELASLEDAGYVLDGRISLP